MATLIWTFLISYLLLFVVSYIVVEYGQNYLYDEVSPGAGVKVGLGSLLLAAMLTWTRSNFATMFTSDIAPTVFQAILWAGVFILIYRFQPWHGFGLAMATMLIMSGTITMAIDSLLAPRSATRIDARESNKPIRRPTYGATPSQPAPAPAKK